MVKNPCLLWRCRRKMYLTESAGGSTMFLWDGRVSGRTKNQRKGRTYDTRLL